MYKDYYAILGLNPKATQQQIKQAYRRLALIYHPDKNANAESHQLFLDISEAYRVLSSSDLKCRYDSGFNINNITTRQYYSKPRQAKAKRNFKAEKEAYFKKYVKIARYISLFTFIYTAILIIDYVLPYKSNRCVIVKRQFDLIQTADFEIPFDRQILTHQLNAGDTINVRTTFFYGIVSKIDFVFENQTLRFSPFYSIYNVFSFFIFIILSTSAYGLRHKKYSEMIVGMAYVNIIFFVLILFIIKMS